MAASGEHWPPQIPLKQLPVQHFVPAPHMSPSGTHICPPHTPASQSPLQHSSGDMQPVPS